MAEPTINGSPIVPLERWVVLMRWHGNGDWWPVRGTIARTRSRAISAYEKSGWHDYTAERRRGEAVAVRCRVEPFDVPETIGDADRRAIADG